LPQDSAFVAAAYRDGRVWTQTDELLAGIAELVSVGHELTYRLAGGKEKWPRVVILRPGQEPEQPRRFATAKELKAFMQRR
jgi:hypothetical protein